MRSKALLLIVVSILVSGGSAQAGWQSWGVRDGLDIHASVVTEDSRGEIWLDGLARFDGVRWHVATLPPGIEATGAVEASPGRFWVATTAGLMRCDGTSCEDFSALDGVDGITAIFRDSAGRVWLGSEDRISRFDPKDSSVVVFTTDDGIVPGIARCFRQDRRGWIWCAILPAPYPGSPAGGVAWFDGVGWSFHSLPGEADALDILVDRDDQVWIASTSGVHRYDGAQWTSFSSDEVGALTVWALAQDSTGAIWAATSTGMSAYRNGTWENWYWGQDFVVVFVDARDHVWFGGRNYYLGIFSIVQFDGRAFRSAVFPPEFYSTSREVRGISQDRSGNLWVLLDGWSGVVKYDMEEWTDLRLDYAATDQLPLALLEDRRGRLWLPTLRGVHVINGNDVSTVTSAEGLSSDATTDVVEDSTGNVWVATINAGLNRFDGTAWTAFRAGSGPGGIASDGASKLFVSSDGSVWTGYASPGGLGRYRNGVWQNYGAIECHVSLPRLFYETPSGVLWVSSGYGQLVSFDGVQWTLAPISAVGGMLEDRQGNMWFVHEDSLVTRFDGSNWRTFTTADGLPQVLASSRNRRGARPIAEDRDGNIWVAMHESGVARFDGLRWSALSGGDTGPFSGVENIIVDRGGNIWLGGGNVYRFDGEHWINFDQEGERPLLGALGIAYEDRAGRLWFSSDHNVVSAYEPDRVAPQTLLVSAPPPLSPSHLQSITFGTAYGEVRGVEFSHSLDDGPWSPWSDEAFWVGSDLSDGMHRFSLRSRDRLGNVDPTPATASFEIDATPPSPLILSPGPNASVSDSVIILGTSADARFTYYRLEVRALGASRWTALVDTSHTPVTNGVLGGWNTRALSDGPYELKLSVSDALGLVGTLVVPVSVDNHFPFAAQTSPALVTAAAGGDVYTADATAHLYISPHGLSRDTIVTVAELDTSAVPAVLEGGATRVSPGVDLNWGTVALEKAATLDLASGGAAAVVYGAGADLVWHRVGGTLDARTGRVAVPVSGPGRYALFDEGGVSVALGSAGLTRLTLTPRVFGPRGGYANGEVAIGFTLGRAAAVTVQVYSRSGRLMREVARDQSMGAGANVVRWDGRDREGAVVEDGLYLVTVEALGSRRTQTLAVVR